MQKMFRIMILKKLCKNTLNFNEVMPKISKYQQNMQNFNENEEKALTNYANTIMLNDV